MVDNTVPTTQFHPYQPEKSTPQADLVSGGLGGILKKVGGMSQNANVEKFRGMAQKNPGMVLGGLAALAIGLGMMRGRR